MKRHHLRSDEEEEIREKIKEKLGIDIEGDIEEVEIDEYIFYIINGEPVLTEFDNEIFLTIKGALDLKPNQKIIYVDSGAVEPISRGADIMRPGIVEKEYPINKDELVVIVEEEHRQPIAIGRVLTDQLKGDEGIAIENLHYVQDEIWRLSEKI